MYMDRFSLKAGCRLLAVLGLCLAIGCGSDAGSKVTGKVTFKGQPVPAGKVYFMPDSAAGNTGQSGFADIKDGEYDTSKSGGQGAPTGKVIVKVEGFDPTPPAGASPDVSMTMLFANYETRLDLPAGASVQNIDVPPEAANPPPGSTEMSTIQP
jgi:hypothetical protein